MNTMDNIDDFLNDDTSGSTEGQKICDFKTGICYIKTNDGLIERTIIGKKLIIEDGRELLIEERPISNTNRNFTR